MHRTPRLSWSGHSSLIRSNQFQVFIRSIVCVFSCQDLIDFVWAPVVIHSHAQRFAVLLADHSLRVQTLEKPLPPPMTLGPKGCGVLAPPVTGCA